MKTGQSTTSFHPATGNPIMTSTTYNRSVAHATDESKTKPSKESNGETLDSNSPGDTLKAYPVLKRGGGRKGVGGRLARFINDLLPRRIRVIKSKRARYKRWYGWRAYVIGLRINWRSIYKAKIMNKLGLRSGINKR